MTFLFHVLAARGKARRRTDPEAVYRHWSAFDGDYCACSKCTKLCDVELAPQGFDYCEAGEFCSLANGHDGPCKEDPPAPSKGPAPIRDLVADALTGIAFGVARRGFEARVGAVPHIVTGEE